MPAQLSTRGSPETTDQGSGEAQDGQQRPGTGEGHVLAVASLLPHLHVGPCDVVGQPFRHRGLLAVAQRDVASGEAIRQIIFLWMPGVG